MTGVEREPLTITLPHGSTGATVWLVAAHCEPLAIRATRQEAEQLCENAERATLADPSAATLTWWAVDAEDADDGPHELYITVSGDEFRTEYTVTPIRIRQEQPPPAPADTPLTNAQRYGHACATCGTAFTDAWNPTEPTTPAGHTTTAGTRWELWRCNTCPAPTSRWVEDAR